MNEHRANPEAQPSTEPWHARTPAATAALLGAALTGLTSEVARERLARHGPNRLDPAPPPSPLTIFVHQFKSPLIFVLALAGAVAFVLGELIDTAFIALVLLVNAIIGFVQELKAERGIRALSSLVRTHARVRRDDHVIDVDGEELVPGDLILLESGLRIPADIRLVDASGLRVDESLLTGESLPVEKDPAPLSASTALGERTNMVYAGAMIVSGRAHGLVIATGKRTEVGAIAGAIASAQRQPPPLVVRMERFARRVGLIVVALALLLVAVGLLRGDEPGIVLLGAIALAVSVIPEGLPVAMTVALSVAVRRMVGRGVVVRHLPAVEGLGSCTVVATDKTGTLTCNELTVERVVVGPRAYRVEGAGYHPVGLVHLGDEPVGAATDPALARLLRVAALANEGELARLADGSWQHSGDPTDIALLAFVRKAGLDPAALLDRHPRSGAIPFEAEHRYAASFHAPRAPDAPPRDRDEATDGLDLTHPSRAPALVCVKGAPENVLAMCARELAVDARGEPSEVALDVSAAMTRVNALMAEGYRVLALADGAVVPEPGRAPSDLVFVGLVAMTDPPREGVLDAIAACHRAGVRVVMITGDHATTAMAIGDRIGLRRPQDVTVTGGEIAALDDEALGRALASCSVVARATPTDKLRVVRVLQAQGDFVAVTGDGVNDAPALRQANLGVAMGKAGTDVAREAADLVITDDNFASIVGGIEEGRVAFDNVRKAIFLLISTGAAEALLVTLSLLAGLPAPFSAAQLLWLNLVTNGIQDVALVFEPGEPGILDRPPRKTSERILDALMIKRTLLAAAVMGGIGLYLWLSWAGAGMPTDEARGMMVHLFVLFEIMHIGNARSENLPLVTLSPLRNPVLLFGTLAAVAIHLGATYFPPTQALLGVAPLSLEQWLTLAAWAAPVLIVMEGHKLVKRARRERPGPARP